MDMLKKRKEEAEQLHLGLEEARKESLQKKNVVEDSRSKILILIQDLCSDNKIFKQHWKPYKEIT